MQFVDLLNNGDSKRSYFLSAAENDRVINLWSIDDGGDSEKNGATKGSIASFIVNDNPVYFDMNRAIDTDEV